jgi:hypothetical protein
MRKSWILGVVGALALSLAGCGGGDDVYVVSGPGLVGIDDSSDATAPLLTVTYRVPNDPTQYTAKILSDPVSDGDIAYDPVLREYSSVQGPLTVQFGIDSFNANLPEYRAFLTFPLDGFNQPTEVVPSNAVILSADVEVFVGFLDFASAVPTFLDLVQYPFRDLGGVDQVALAANYNQPYLARRSPFDFFASDAGNFVQIEVTSLMQQAQVLGVIDFQLRFSRDMSVPPLSPSRPSASVGRRVVSSTRSVAGSMPVRKPAAAKPLSPAELAARRR